MQNYKLCTDKMVLKNTVPSSSHIWDVNGTMFFHS